MSQNGEQDDETLPQWCARVGVTIQCEPSSAPPHDPKWEADGWTCTLTLEGRTLVTPYWCGIGHREWKVMKGPTWQSPGKDWRQPEQQKDVPRTVAKTVHDAERAWFRPIPPDAASVLHSLLMDASEVEHGQSFEGWCDEYGFDPDSRKAEAMYKACQAIALNLRGFLGARYEDAQRASQDY